MEAPISQWSHQEHQLIIIDRRKRSLQQKKNHRYLQWPIWKNSKQLKFVKEVLQRKLMMIRGQSMLKIKILTKWQKILANLKDLKLNKRAKLFLLPNKLGLNVKDTFMFLTRKYLPIYFLVTMQIEKEG